MHTTSMHTVKVICFNGFTVTVNGIVRELPPCIRLHTYARHFCVICFDGFTEKIEMISSISYVSMVSWRSSRDHMFDGFMECRDDKLRHMFDGFTKCRDDDKLCHMFDGFTECFDGFMEKI
ncbi:hypothetical protein AMTR_s00122p00075950 [Amborella trichopoda]|uniref:Uncharacterized protein n=1 Tax=Amborella trichopoda TaxID=13333 RepID=W1NN56_AMBTC|nr:hypothetical protein AMTR_s00122p00075950 [Amborella trichopoda]